MKYIKSFEGLIKTHTDNEVFKYLQKQKEKNNVYYHPVSNGAIKIFYRPDNIIHGEKIHKTMTNVLGYYLAGIQYDLGDEFETEDIENPDFNLWKEILDEYDDDYGENNSAAFMYEKKFDAPYIGKNRTLYHVTDNNNVKDILKRGLIPKAHHKLLYHPERVYFMTDLDGIQEFINHPSSMISYPTILEVDTTGIDLYIDPNHPKAVYTYDNINPNKISVLKENEEKDDMPY